jgi:hypothetical protein
MLGKARGDVRMFDFIHTWLLQPGALDTKLRMGNRLNGFLVLRRISHPAKAVCE